MADILSALGQLEDLEREKKRKPGKKNSVSANTKANARAGRSRVPRTPNNPPAQSAQTKSQSPNRSLSVPGDGERSPSVAPSVNSGRRISFVEGPRPDRTERRLRISTRGASLASGFPYDPKLVKYNVKQEEWKDFSDALIEAADLPKRATWAWRFHKGEVIKKMRREVQYEGSGFKRALNAWNRHFKKKGFQASLELPGPPKIKDTDTEEEKESARKECKFFNLCITPTAEKAGSIYSRTSSMTRSVSGEGIIKTPVQSDDELAELADETDGPKENKAAEE